MIRNTSPETEASKRLSRLFEHPDPADLLYFLASGDPEEIDALYAFADSVRRQFVGDDIHLRAIIEFSNHCIQGCLYCGLHQQNRELVRYRMEEEEILKTVSHAAESGYRTVVLQSGEDPWYTREVLVQLIAKIRKRTDMAITLALGERPSEEYETFFNAGADRYLLKHETADPELYARLNPGMRLSNRLNCLKELKRIGFQTGSGIMIGLPGQTLESIAEDIMLFYRMDMDMIGCGPYIPNPGCPAGMANDLREELSYRVLALNRIVTRNAHLPSTTALSTLNENDARKKALQRGANVIMPNVTPEAFRRHYQIYPSKRRIEVATGNFRIELEQLAREMDRRIGTSRGDRKKDVKKREKA